MKKILAAAVLAGILVIPVVGNAADYSWADTAVDYCMEKGIIQGDDDGDLALGANLTREQMAKMLVDAFDLLP